MMMMNIIMAVYFVPIWPIIYFFIRNYAKPHKLIILGVTLPLNVHEDDYWMWGFIYNNPNDNHLMVNYRVGIGMSVNIAKPAGKILMGFAALSIALMPFIGV